MSGWAQSGASRPPGTKTYLLKTLTNMRRSTAVIARMRLAGGKLPILILTLGRLLMEDCTLTSARKYRISGIRTYRDISKKRMRTGPKYLKNRPAIIGD